MRRILFLRHGHVYNPEGIFYRRLPGFHLSARGRAEADLAARAIAREELSVIVSSPLERAQETAAFVSRFHPRARFRTDEDLSEWDDGELSAMVAGRMLRGVRRILGDLTNGANALVVSHRDAILSALSAVTNEDFLTDLRKREAVTASIFEAAFDRGDRATARLFFAP